MEQVTDAAQQSADTEDATEGSDNAEPGQSFEPAARGLLSRWFGGRSSADEPQIEQSHPPAPVPPPGLGNLRRMRVGDVAIPKVEIEAVPVTISRDELVQKFREHGYSRLPVFKETLDTPLGLVHLKDLALEYGFGSGNGRFNLRKLIRPLLYVPPSMPIGVLLQKMQVQRIHMALVIDEYGGVDGLLTLEDLIEQVIGEIEDEHDETDDGYWREEKPGQWIVQARAPVHEFESVTGIRLADAEADDEIDSMGGLLFMQLGRVPARGEVVVTENGVEYEVIDADPRRIKRLRVRLPGVAAAE
ncbi:hemolysin family protein [Thioclava sp. 15-R06ZXC-3]|uniref:Hemolysin family protein n=1 Tax=Thioclava arctica TaxID=3238301 RepID=A0ABV3TGE9_9RHOB